MQVTFGQKRPDLNESIYQLYCSATTQRRIAKLLGINRKTVARKFLFLAEQARLAHSAYLENQRCDSVQLDEMESFEHTRLKPLSIVLAVSPEMKILCANVASMSYRGSLAHIALRKYGYRKDERSQVLVDSLNQIKPAVVPKSHIATDANPRYPKPIQAILKPKLLTQHHSKLSHPVKRLALRRRNHQDPLFAVNHTAAKIRHDLSRMARRVWTTTKLSQRLQAHLYLYIAFHNQYALNF